MMPEFLGQLGAVLITDFRQERVISHCQPYESSIAFANGKKPVQKHPGKRFEILIRLRLNHRQKAIGLQRPQARPRGHSGSTEEDAPEDV